MVTVGNRMAQTALETIGLIVVAVVVVRTKMNYWCKSRIIRRQVDLVPRRDKRQRLDS